MNDCDELIDRLVTTLNSRGLELLPHENVPEELRLGLPDEVMWVEWQIRRSDHNPWIAELEQVLPVIFPRVFHSLISRYRFAELDLGPCMLFANTGCNVFYELKERMFIDPYLSPVLLKNGFLHIGHPYAGNYDCICFDMHRGTKADAPVVQIDHEDILIRNGKITVVAEIALSFRNLVEQVISGEFLGK